MAPFCRLQARLQYCIFGLIDVGPLAQLCIPLLDACAVLLFPKSSELVSTLGIRQQNDEGRDEAIRKQATMFPTWLP